MKKKYSEYNKTPDGKMACAFGTLWEHHFDGTGCRLCDDYTYGHQQLRLEFV